MHLKCSNGSKHVLQLKEALQAVEPKGDTRFVSLLLQIGQGMMRSSPVRKALSWLKPSGGAMPFCVIFSRALSEIQSVVQAGLMAIRTSDLGSITRAAASTSFEMTSVAGQPEYVGVMMQIV